VALLAADGALEAAPAMGTADIILDLVSTGAAVACRWARGQAT
jgi:ATP phosphoribosyltransferase